MGWRQAFVAIAVAGTWGLGVSAGRAAPQTADWFLIKLTAGPAGASNVVARTSTSGTFVGSGPRVFGSGIATPGGSAVGAFDLGAGDTSITTTKGLGSQQATVLPARNGQFSLASGIGVSSIGPGETVALLNFITGVAFSPPTLSVQAGSGTVASALSFGSGSTAILVGDPIDSGAAANAGGVGAGEFSHALSSSAGLVGGVTFDCVGCTGTWASPDGRSGTWEGAGTGGPSPLPIGGGYVSGSASFAGPAGSWNWQWVGAADVLLSPPTVAAFAPIGADWTLFG